MKLEQETGPRRSQGVQPTIGSNLVSNQRLRLLSYNIQTGIHTFRYHHYVTRSWQHVLPDFRRFHNLERIADVLRTYDVVGLQEVDSGSLRSGFVDQTKYLAIRGGFPFWHSQTTRRVGKFAQHSNGLIARIAPREVFDYRLPGLPGRGAIVARFGSSRNSLALIILHLALSRRGRLRQIAFVSEIANEYPNVVLMGDLNCEPNSPEMQLLLRRTQLDEPVERLPTFPSWRPNRVIDHILVSRSLRVQSARVLNYAFSDHLPVALEIRLPEGLFLSREPLGHTTEPVIVKTREILRH